MAMGDTGINQGDAPNSDAIEIPPQTVAGMTADYIAGSHSMLADGIFAERGKPAPEVAWQPSPADMPVEGLRFLMDYWQVACGDADLPPAEAIDPFTLKPVLGDVIVLEVEEGGRDFRYRLYGTHVADASRFDWTGRSVEDMRRSLKGPGPAFYLAIYRAVLMRRQPVYTLSPAGVMFADRFWARLVLPFGNPVTRIVVGNYALGTDFIDPVVEHKLEILRTALRAGRPDQKPGQKPGQKLD